MRESRERRAGEDETHLPLARNISYRLSVLNFFMTKATREIYRERGLNSHEWKVLSVLHAFGPMSGSDILPRVTLDKPAISRALANLRALGLATAEPRAENARFIDVALTAKGRRLYRAMNDDARALQRRLLQDLDAADRARLFRLIDTLESRLRRELD